MTEMQAETFTVFWPSLLHSPRKWGAIPALAVEEFCESTVHEGQMPHGQHSGHPAGHQSCRRGSMEWWQRPRLSVPGSAPWQLFSLGKSQHMPFHSKRMMFVCSSSGLLLGSTKLVPFLFQTSHNPACTWKRECSEIFDDRIIIYKVLSMIILFIPFWFGELVETYSFLACLTVK